MAGSAQAADAPKSRADGEGDAVLDGVGDSDSDVEGDGEADSAGSASKERVAEGVAGGASTVDAGDGVAGGSAEGVIVADASAVVDSSSRNRNPKVEVEG